MKPVSIIKEICTIESSKALELLAYLLNQHQIYNKLAYKNGNLLIQVTTYRSKKDYERGESNGFYYDLVESEGGISIYEYLKNLIELKGNFLTNEEVSRIENFIQDIKGDDENITFITNFIEERRKQTILQSDIFINVLAFKDAWIYTGKRLCKVIRISEGYVYINDNEMEEVSKVKYDYYGKQYFNEVMVSAPLTAIEIGELKLLKDNIYYIHG
jgi:hypothetical protein